MVYIELKCRISEHVSDYSEILIAQLFEIGFEMFEENENGFNGYINKDSFDEKLLSEIALLHNPAVTISLGEVENRNWNKEWESNFQPVIIGGDVYVRAEFHPPVSRFKHEIIIQPEMSFGTGHHETTAAMIELMLNYDWKDKIVCDMGCGTGILAIMAEKLGAAKITAIDNDEICIPNAGLNFLRNHCTHITAEHGDAALLHENSFDIILANINRNILLEGVKYYAAALHHGGLLFVSGFYEEDFSIIKSAFEKHQLHYKESLLKNNWCAAVFYLELAT